MPKEKQDLIKALDHVAVPMQSVKEMIEFYSMLGCKVNKEREGLMYSVCFGNNKINFHTPSLWKNETFQLRGMKAQPGCGDFCFVWKGTLQSLYDTLKNVNVKIEEGPVERTGGKNCGSVKGKSIYIRDPDSNLLEFIIY